MGRVDLKQEWSAEGSLTEVQARIEEFLRGAGMRLDSSPGEIRARQGSQVMTRMLGGWFVSSRWLPKRAVLRLYQEKDLVRVDAFVEESLGIGWIDSRFKERYISDFERWMAGLKGITS